MAKKSKDENVSGNAADTDTSPVKTRKAPKIGKSFSARNPTPIGAIGLVFILVLLFAAFNASSLPLIGGGTEYTARFKESANLQPDDDVRIAGVRVGQVDDVTVKDDVVTVKFTIKQGYVGDRSTVDIQLRTLLGAKYLAVDSIGTKAQNPDAVIGESRTSSPFDVYPAFTKLTDTIDEIDTNQLQTAFKTLSDDFRNTGPSVAPVVSGLSRLSETIASRDNALRTLLARANQVTGVLADRDAELQKLLADGSLLLDELNRRRDAIRTLFANTTQLSLQLRGLVADNQETLGPLLDNLDRLLDFLNKNEENLNRGIALLGPFYRVFNNVIGSGRWFDNYIQNFNLSTVAGLITNPLIGNLPSSSSAASTVTGGR